MFTTVRNFGIIAAILLSMDQAGFAVDTVELSTGATARGTIRSHSGTSVVIAVRVGNRTVTRTYPKNRIKAYTINGKRFAADSTPIASTSDGDRPRAEILAEIERQGKTPPDWFDETPLNYPKTLDLSWPMPPPKGWNSSKNVGQFLWDRINPNANKWREGVRFMHHLLSISREEEVRKRAMRTLGSMYHNLLQDHARSAFWFRQSGLEQELSKYPQPAVFLADSYWKLGSKSMALEIVTTMPRRPYIAIKLFGDIGETDRAIRLAEAFAKTGVASMSFLYAGDACRVAGRLEDAESYYRKAIAGIPVKEAGKPHRKRDRARAEASIAAIRFYSLDPKNVADGKYSASSIGYEGPVTVEVVVQSGKIESVQVTRHREKQYYSSLKDTPEKIVARQSVAGIDATSSATITSEAIINATAKALSSGLK